ncbi:jasmonate-induced protein homolog [Silene latifolia]|uniref:jasmonate-induced protein homolog n=1 Tax=Silene latifolia TaxID=37657 RepID=UPI003D76CA99
MADSNGENMQQAIQKATIITVNNKGSGAIRMGRFKSWMGNSKDTQVLPLIPSKTSDKFTVLNGEHGAIAGFQYNGNTISGEECGLVVTWDAPTVYNPPNVSNKVFTYGSSKELADKNTWEEILEKLAKASSTAPHASIVHQEPDTASLVVDVNMDNWFRSAGEA